MKLRTIKDVDVKDKIVLCRVDLNVPMKNGRVEDGARIEAVIPTIKHLIKQNAKIVLLSHFGRPNGEFDRDLSLAPIADEVSKYLDGIFIKFAVDCVGEKAQNAVDSMQKGDVLLLENLRFHKGEKSNDESFVNELAKLGDVYINDTLSCSHRSHASIVGIAQKLPSAAGFLLEKEIESLNKITGSSEGAMAAIVGGSKVSTKLSLLDSLIKKTDLLLIGGAMANTFLKAKGYNIGKSLYEADLVDKAHSLIKDAENNNCNLFLPIDVVTAKHLENNTECFIRKVDDVKDEEMILDLGSQTVAKFSDKLKLCQTLVWNGPLGAFEYRPFDAASISLAQNVAYLTSYNKLTSVAGGGDVVAALKVSGLQNSFSYISTAGGAFLQWLEGNGLPGVNILYSDA